jgi:hypothetical protein
MFEDFFENLSRKFNSRYILTRLARTLHEDLCTFTIISRWIILRVRNFSDKIIVKMKSHNNFMSENLAFYEMWKVWCKQTGHRWQYNTAHAHCVLANVDYRHSFRLCNTYCSSHTLVTWTYLTYLICLVFIPYFLRWKYGSYDEPFIGKFDTHYPSGKYRMSTDPVHNLKRIITW